jgi:hypothetical protein
VIVKLELPQKVWGRLASIADNKGSTVALVLAEAIDTLLAVTAPDDGNRVFKDVIPTDPVIRAYQMGMSDGQIARALGMTNRAVSVRRRQFGLPARRRGLPAE